MLTQLDGGQTRLPGKPFLAYCLVTALLNAAGLPTSAQTTYYVAASGNDAGDGRSPNAPFQSPGKVGNLNLQPGDAVLFRRGDTFVGTLTIRQSGTASQPITFDAYGNGPRPVLTGSVPISGWSNLGSGRWQASCPACGSRVTGLYRNGAPLPLGRYPNADAPNRGYLTIQSHSGKTQLTSRQGLPTDFTGAEAVVRPQKWVLDRATITAQNGNTLALANTSAYDLADGWGYFIQSHPATLDRTGEWYYNPAGQTLLLYDNEGNPNDQAITATAFDQAISLTGASNVTIQNLTITGARTTNLAVLNASNLTLSGNDVTNAGEDALRIDGSGTGILVQNNRLYRANNNGFYIGRYQNVTVRNNLVRNIGLVPGRSRSGDGQSLGVLTGSDANTLIEGNVVDSIGFNGIGFTNNTIIRRNTISNFCMTKADGGGLYIRNGDRQAMSNLRILSNMVFNGIGAPDGSPDDAYSGANGIYLDDCTQNVEVSGNTVFNCLGLGIYLHATTNVSLTGNTSFNNGEGQLLIGHNHGLCQARGNSITNNAFVSKQPGQFVVKYESDQGDLGSYGSFDNNCYARPFNDVFTVRAVQRESAGVVGNDLALSEWQPRFQKDPNSSVSPLVFKSYSVNGTIGGYRLSTSFGANTENWSVWSPYGNGQASWSNGGQLDGGSLQVAFPNGSGRPDSYVIVTNPIGSVNRTKSYLLQFDAVASGPNKRLQAFLRQRDAPYADLNERFATLVGTTRRSYEIAFTATADEASAIAVFQVNEDGQTLWIDNVRLQEVSISPVSPDDCIRFAYNPTPRDSTVRLDGVYRDVRNQTYSRSLTLTPFTSLVLLKDLTAQGAAATPSGVDLDLSLQSSRRFCRPNEVITFGVRVRNTTPNGMNAPIRTQWSCPLPDNLQFVGGDGLSYANGMLTGTVADLSPLSEATFTFLARPLAAGLYRTAAQITAAAFPDPDSQPSSGTADGEDDAATADLRVGSGSPAVYASPNPGQRALPTVSGNQPPPDPAKADLSLHVDLSSRSPAVNEIITCTLTVSNAGGPAVGTVQVQNQLPAGLQFVGGNGWSSSGSLLNASLGSLSAGASASLSFQAKVIGRGRWVNQSQISAATVSDPDSVPGNGFTNGEDDQAQTDIRVR